MRRRIAFITGLLAVNLAVAGIYAAGASRPVQSIFAKDNLVAWCIVPYDAAKRGPEERAQMLNRLGIQKVAYDWRAEHVPTFEEEILAYQKHHLEYFAFWDWHPSIAPLIKKYGIKPQIWKSFGAPAAGTEEEKVRAAAKALMPLVDQTRALGCKLGLYNHGGWGGEPKNLVAVCEYLRKTAPADHVGIVYNLHHGHGHIKDFAESLTLMMPYLLCVNLNGMNTDAKPMILPLGKGEHEAKMLEIIAQSGYHGPIGILGHRPEVDAEKSLTENLQGLKQLLQKMGDQKALATFEK